jgi:hypothetical protein
MDKHLPAVGEIKSFFPKHRQCVVKVLILLLECVIQSGTVNLNKCKTKAGIVTGQKGQKLSTVYTRFIRFFKIKHRDAFCMGITLFILSITHLSGVAYLVVDRTNWDIGQTRVNVLCLGLLLPNGIFIPILWENLSKKGNSCTKERLDLLKRFQSIWQGSPKHKFIVLADREFVGLDFFTWMLGHDLSFVIRLRWQDYFGLVAAACDLTVDKLERKIRNKVKENGCFQASFTYLNHTLYFTVLPNGAKRRTKAKSNPGDDFVVLVSVEKQIDKISQDYRKRWGIEVFFRHAKKNGFNMEDLNLKEQQKIQLLIGVVAIAYCLSIRQGLTQEQQNITKIKKHGAKAVSTFRNGLDNLRNNVFNLKDMIKFLNELIIDFQNINFEILKSV